MILELLSRDPLTGRLSRIVIPATQILIRQLNGTPIAIAADYGPEGATAVASAAFDNNEFHRTMRNLGIDATVLVSTIKMPPPPPGARLLADPTTDKR